MKVDVLLGLQWGDEGKGKIVDVLTPEYNVITRFQGGPNAGHTLEFDNYKHVLHTIPSGIFHDTINVIGNGVVIDPVILKQEVEKLKGRGVTVKNKLYISKKAHLILPSHKMLDAAQESLKGAGKIGSTLKGIGPTYTDKVSRNGLRVGDISTDDFMKKYNCLKDMHKNMLQKSDVDNESFPDGTKFSEYEKLWFEGIEEIKNLRSIDSEYYINSCLNEGKSVLAEGAQGTMLDIDFGSYPFVTSSNTICAGACTGLGVAPTTIGKVFGIFKAYCTRVGSGPFPTELFDETGETMRKIGREFGATTGRPRRCGWLDLPALKYSVMLNGVTDLIMMKADVLNSFETIKVCTHYNYKGKIIDYVPYDINSSEIIPVYEELKGWNHDLTGIESYDDMPSELVNYINFIEKKMNVPVNIVSIGPDRTQTIIKKDLFIS
ncbi:MAG: adenylosuccinate synthase [Bacteroidota bacterium]|nr:adenylosuccinate synthase [Bacteroidota bacterium]